MMSDPTKSIANDCLKNGKTSSSDEDLQSLSQLADQPQKLHRTLFRMIEKKQIKKMLPPSLKKMKTSAVKQLCLEKLEQISKKSIVKMIVGDESPMSSPHSDHHEAKSDRGPPEAESPRHKPGGESEIEKSTPRDAPKNHSPRNKSPGHKSSAETHDSPTSSSWTSASGERRWSRSPSADRTPPAAPRRGSDPVRNQTAAGSNQEASAWLEDLDTDELELRARALRSLSNRLDRLQGRVPDRE